MAPFDCELLRDGWPAQPVNALSATAFVVAGIWLWRRGRRLPAALAVAVGAGSAWFHAAPGGAATWAHDLTLYALGIVSAIEVGRLIAGRRPPVVAAAIFAAGLIIWFLSRTGGALCDPGSVIQGHAVWHLAASSAVGALFSHAGRSGNPRS